MSRPSTKQVRSVQGDTLDLICWRELGQTSAVTEAVMADPANHGLVGLGPILPSGTLVTLPDAPPPPTQTLVSLWS